MYNSSQFHTLTDFIINDNWIKVFTISLPVFIVWLLFQLFVEELSCLENIFRSFPSSSKYTMSFLFLRLIQELKHWKLFTVHPVNAVHRARINWYLQVSVSVYERFIEQDAKLLHGLWSGTLLQSFDHHLHIVL